LSSLKQYCDDETAPYRDSMRETDTRVRPDVRERVRSGLAELIRSRCVSTDDIWRASWVRRGLLTRTTCTSS
jgi:hypothetical protein